MGVHDSKYVELLKAMLETLVGIYKNTVSQKDALAKKDDLSVKKLLIERQILIDEIAEMSRKKSEFSGSRRDEKEESMEKSIRLLLKNIELLNASNIQQAEMLKSELALKISHIRIGKGAITKGYYKKTPTRYGSFIDKRVGK